MPDASGRDRTLGDFRGKAVVLFFGFAQCPDVCPGTLADAAAALKELGPKAADVQVLFVTLDPDRDTPEVLVEYVKAFDPTFIALRGNSEQLDRTAKLFKVHFAKIDDGRGGYTIEHTAGKYVMDQQGRPRLWVQHDAGPSVLARDLAELLK